MSTTPPGGPPDDQGQGGMPACESVHSGSAPGGGRATPGLLGGEPAGSRVPAVKPHKRHRVSTATAGTGAEDAITRLLQPLLDTGSCQARTREGPPISTRGERCRIPGTVVVRCSSLSKELVCGCKRFRERRGLAKLVLPKNKSLPCPGAKVPEVSQATPSEAHSPLEDKDAQGDSATRILSTRCKSNDQRTFLHT